MARIQSQSPLLGKKGLVDNVVSIAMTKAYKAHAKESAKHIKRMVKK